MQQPINAVHLECCVCGLGAGKFKQWWNRDDGYGICDSCAVEQAQIVNKEEFIKLYGHPGVNLSGDVVLRDPSSDTKHERKIEMAPTYNPDDNERDDEDVRAKQAEIDQRSRKLNEDIRQTEIMRRGKWDARMDERDEEERVVERQRRDQWNNEHREIAIPSVRIPPGKPAPA